MVENLTIKSFIDFAKEFNQLSSKEINKIQLIKLNAFLDDLISNKSQIKKILEQTNSDQLLFSLADRCTTGKLQSEEIAVSYKKVLHKILNIIRTPALLQFINKNKRENEWVKLILRLIKLSNYTTGDLFLQRVEEYDERPLFKVLNSNKITNYNWTDIYIKVFQIAGALLKAAGEKISKTRVAIISENNIEMICIDLACLITGIVNIPIPLNSTTDNVEFILSHSHSSILFVSGEEQLNEILKIRNNLPAVEKVILFNTALKFNDASITQFDNFLLSGSDISNDKLFNAINAVKPGDLATIMYTSGTTQAPKGIMFSQMNIISKRFCRALALPEIGENDRFICYLPLYHTFGRYFEMMGCIFWGATYIFLENPKIETLVANMNLVKPTVFISIPKKWMQLYEIILEKVDVEHAEQAEITKTVKQITGGSLKWGLSAAGYLDPDIFRFFQSAGIEIMSGFGMTEATGGITMTPPFQYKDNSVGLPLPGIDIKLSPESEMLIKGCYVMLGYLGEKKAGFTNGWLHTGDIFTKDLDGYYQIIDRKKEIYKNTRGETISPQKIENLFHDFEAVKTVFLVGDHREFNTLLLYPNYDYDQINLKKLNQAKLREFFSSLIVSVNQFLAPFERIVDFAIIDREFNENAGELTAKGTYKRKAIEENFSDLIEKMYLRDHISLYLKDFEIRIPSWYLRQKAFTSDDLKLQKSTLINTSNKKVLKFKLTQKNAVYKIQIGNYFYSTSNNYIELSKIINNPALWLGNLEFRDFIGSEVFKVNKTTKSGNSVELSLSSKQTRINKKYITELNNKIEQGDFGVNTVNLAAFIIQSWDEKNALKAIDFLEKIIHSNNENTTSLAQIVLMRTIHSDNQAIKKKAFQVLLFNEKGDLYKPILDNFLLTKHSVLDEETIAEISPKALSKDQLKGILNYLNTCLIEIRKGNENGYYHPTHDLLNFITAYGINHPIAYKRIRIELVKCYLSPVAKAIQKQAKSCFTELQKGFRKWLGANYQIAIDPETADEIRWQDVISFEHEIPEEHKKRISQALQNYPVIREAIFLFSGGKVIQLQEIPHNGIWISLLGTRHGKSVYRVSIQTHHYGSFDLAINLNDALTKEEVESEINWLICAGATDHAKPLVEDFGGFWPDYDLWTEEFIPGDTVEKHLNRLNKQTSQDIDKLQQLWPSFVWNGLSAYVDFWNRTNRKLIIAAPAPANVIVPSHDFQVGFRIVSISGRKKFDNLIDMMLEFRNNYILPVESKYDVLKDICGWEVIFSSFLEILGEDKGLQTLHTALQTARNMPQNKIIKEITLKLKKFIKIVRETGYHSERLHFAIERFKRWYALNPDATPRARVQTLRDLYTTYILDRVERRYPGSRIQFFRDTVFAKSDKKLLQNLNLILQQLKKGKISKHDLPDQFAELRYHHELNEAELTFLTRLSYPHLGAKDTVKLISLTAEGVQKTALVVFMQDYDGNQLAIRQPVSPKEIARLHKLFTMANLPVDFKPVHKFLVILNTRNSVIGGLFYRPVSESQVHMEKVVVDELHRRKNVSEGLLNEFFNRIRSDGVEIVTVGFLRPEYFQRFGFKLDHRFGNMVKRLDSEQESEMKVDLIENF